MKAINFARYFDTVNHDKLMSLVSREIKDKRVLRLIKLFLQSGEMINGVVNETEEGCSQGGTLSSLISNMMFMELDREIEKRSHKFCNYADDKNIYVKRRKVGERVMRRITEFIGSKLKLEVNKDKSTVDRLSRSYILSMVWKDRISKYINSIELPCTERYPRWCKRYQNKIIIQLLLDLRIPQVIPMVLKSF